MKMDDIRSQRADAPVSRGEMLLSAILTAALVVFGWTLATITAPDATRASPAATGSAVDIGFAQFMGIHHEQAVMMADILLDGEPSALTPLARNIQRAQLLEIGQMQGWLHLWQQPLTPPSLSMNWMRLADVPPSPELARYLIDCENSPGGMPGLATDEQMAALRTSTGAERERLFLELMSAHHKGGLPMAHFAAEHASHPAVRHLADHVISAQEQELLWMAERQREIDPEP